MKEMIMYYFDEEKVTSVGKNGFVSKDGTCSVLVKYSDLKSKILFSLS
jgi:hypothetical protein